MLKLEKKHLKSENFRQAAILSFFFKKCVFRIAEDILNHSRAISRGRFSVSLAVLTFISL